jgi:hypothetical protein
MAEPELWALMDRVIEAWAALDDAHRHAQAAGQVERAGSLNLAQRAVGDGALALDELLEAEGTPYPRPPKGGPKGGLRVAA